MCQIKTQPGQKPTETAVVEYNAYRDATTKGIVLRVQLATFIPPIDAPYAEIKFRYEQEKDGKTTSLASVFFEDRRYSITEKQATCPTMKIALEMVADAIQSGLKANR